MWDPLCAEFNRKETQWRCSPEFSLLSEWETRSWNFILASPGIHVKNFEDMRAAMIVPDCSSVCQQLCLSVLVYYDHRFLCSFHHRRESRGKPKIANT